MPLLAVTSPQLLYIESYSLPFYMCWFCTLHVIVYVVLPTCLPCFLYVGWHIMYNCSLLSLLHLVHILVVGSCEKLMDYPILGE